MASRFAVKTDSELTAVDPFRSGADDVDEAVTEPVSVPSAPLTFVTRPPAVIFNVPLVLRPMKSPPVFVHFEPAPLTFTVPSAKPIFPL